MTIRALVQSGGGAKGAYQVGVLHRWLHDEERHYEINAGTSIGAINALKLVQHKKGDEKKAWSELHDIWTGVSTPDVYKRWFPLGMIHGLWQPALYNSAPLRELIAAHVDRDKVLQSGKVLRMGAVSLDSGEYTLFDETTEDLVSAVLASASYPVFLLPIRIDGELYSDGGIRTVTPLKAAIDAGATEVDVIMTQTYPATWSPLKDPDAIDIAQRTLSIMTNEIVENDLKLAVRHNERIADGRGGPGRRHIPIRVVRPRTGLGCSSLDFDPEKIRRMIERGKADAAMAG